MILMIFTLRTTVGQESLVVDILSNKVKEEGLSVYSLSVIPGLKGYVLIEADSELTVRRAIANTPHIKGKGIVGGQVKIEELSSLLEAKPLMKSIKEGMKVELITGPFKGEKARVLRVNPTKEEVTVELLEAAVKIPVTIRAEHIRILKE
ncbi:MAG: transcription elongation factor Spt5 [Candidatus Diapherotrites archaeon]